MTINDELVSIIVNVFNGEKYITSCLQSIVDQSYSNYEVIICDNCSTDSTPFLLDKFRVNNKFKFYKTSKNIALHQARQFAYKNCKGRYIMFLDCDDIWNKNKVKECVKAHNDFNSALVYSNFFYKSKGEKWIAHKSPLKSGYSLQKSKIRKYDVGLLTLSIDKKVLHNKNDFFFNKSYFIIGDFDLVIRLLKKNRIQYIDECLGVCRLHKNNLSKTKKLIWCKEILNWMFFNLKILDFITCLFLFKLILNNLIKRIFFDR